MSCPKSTINPQMPQNDTFTIQLTKKMVNFIKAALPLRYTLQIHSKRNDRNNSNSLHQQKKNSKFKSKQKINVKVSSSDIQKSKQKVRGITDDTQIRETKQKQFLNVMKQSRVLVHDQNEINSLKNQISKFFEVMLKRLLNNNDLQKRLAKIKLKFLNNVYRNFTQFEGQIKTIKDKIVLKELSKIIQKIQTYFISSSINNDQHTLKLQAEKKVDSNATKNSKNIKKTIKVAQKQLKAINFPKKNVPLPKDLFQVTEQAESSTNSAILIDSFEAGSINQLVKKLNRFDQCEIIRSVSQKCGFKLFKNLTRGQATELVTKIKRMMKRQSYEDRLGDNEVESSFQIESDE